MSSFKERSGLFKFFYIVLSVFTFPIFAIIYIIKHPKSFLVILLILAGVVAYFPLKNGVKYNDIIGWYKDKYNETKLQVLTSVVDEDSILLSDKMAKDVKALKEERDNLEKEKNMVKGENFNENIKRSDDIESIVQNVRRKGGFKKKGETKRIKTAESLIEDGQKVQGLKEFMLQKEQLEKDKLINDGDVMLFEDDNEKLGKQIEFEDIENINEKIEPLAENVEEIKETLDESVVEDKNTTAKDESIEKHNVFDENMIDLELGIDEPKEAKAKEEKEEKEEIIAEPEELELF